MALYEWPCISLTSLFMEDSESPQELMNQEPTADSPEVATSVVDDPITESESVVPTNASIVHTSMPVTPQPTEVEESELEESNNAPELPPAEERTPLDAVQEAETEIKSEPLQEEEHSANIDRLNFMDQQDDGYDSKSVSEDGREPESAQPERTVLYSDLTSWKNKKYLGGYRKKQIEYFHAEAQTTTPQEIQAAV
jgi:hypothetical protein